MPIQTPDLHRVNPLSNSHESVRMSDNKTQRLLKSVQISLRLWLWYMLLYSNLRNMDTEEGIRNATKAYLTQYYPQSLNIIPEEVLQVNF